MEYGRKRRKPFIFYSQYDGGTHVYFRRKIKSFDQKYISGRISEVGKNIINIVIDNFKITVKKIKDLKAEGSDLKDCLEFTENVIEKKLKNWKLN